MISEDRSQKAASDNFCMRLLLGQINYVRTRICPRGPSLSTVFGFGRPIKYRLELPSSLPSALNSALGRSR